MENFKLKIHSVIDLITNSSTEIFIDFSKSLKPCKEMINEMFKVCNIDKTCDEVFDITLTFNDDYGDEYCDELLISAKDDKYDPLIKFIKEFLESTEEIEIHC